MTKIGSFSKPFFAQQGTSNSADVYIDPFAFMSQRRKDLFPTSKANNGQLVLMSQDPAIVDIFVTENRHVAKLRLVTFDPKNPTRN